MRDSIAPRLAAFAAARTGDELAAHMQAVASDYGFASVALIDFASACNLLDRIVDTAGFRGRWLLDFLSGPSGRDALILLSAERPSVALSRQSLAGRPDLLAQLESVDILDALMVPVIANGRLASLMAFCGGRAPLASPARHELECLGLAALAYFPVLPQPNADPARVYLTDREQQVLRLAAAGLTSREIADNLGMSMRTTNQHLDNAGNKLATRNRAHTVAEAIRLGLLN